MTAEVLEGQIAWVTGASSGIGSALARALADRGARVILSARREAELRRVRDDCSRSGEHWVWPVDLEQVDQLPEVARAVVETTGGVDLLVHAAGLGHRDRVERTQLAVDRRLMELNYFAPVALTKALLPSLLERRGRILVVSSILGKIGVPGSSAYCASKHALHGFFEALRAETHHEGLHVTLLCPGFVRTEAGAKALTGDGQPAGGAIPTSGMQPEMVADRAIEALLRESEEAVLGGRETIGVHLRRLSRRLSTRLVRRKAGVDSAPSRG